MDGSCDRDAAKEEKRERCGEDEYSGQNFEDPHVENSEAVRGTPFP
jgi:hypothetical protein